MFILFIIVMLFGDHDPPGFCGNGQRDPGENCLTCPKDVPCNDGVCVGGVCLLCGNGQVDPGENCSNCPADVPCDAWCQECVGGECLDIPVCDCPEATDPCVECHECLDGECVYVCAPKCIEPPIDVVFLMDTSGSMGDEAADLCSEISSVQAELFALGVEVNVHLFGIADNPPAPFDCLTDNVQALYGSPPHIESWGPATSIIAAQFPWVGSGRLVVPIGDEGPLGGDPCNDPGDDRDSIDAAIVAANENGVLVSPIAGTPISDPACMIQLGQDLAAGTSGSWHLAAEGGIAAAILDLIAKSLCCDPIGIEELLDLLANWTGIEDFLALLAGWGECV